MTTMTDRKYIADFGPAERFEGAFTIANAQLGTTRAGKPYLRALLSDKTGQLPARMWSISEEYFHKLPTDGFVFAEGDTQPFQGELQLIVQNIQPITPTSQQLRELLPTTQRDIDEMYNEVVALLDSLEHPSMKALAQEYINDERLMDEFRTTPAAKMLHHAYLGGLLEHTLTLMQIADKLCPLYPRINRDIVLLGLFLHDLGKTRELSYHEGFSYTDRGELIGHLVEGAIMLHDKAQQAMVSSGQRIPANAITILQHIIISHHGKPEFGAAKIPASPEAIFVANIDELDAHTIMALDAGRPQIKRSFSLGGNFTEKHWGLGTKIFRPDPLKD
ncbi:MAG: 3'-5' exoribonuclease YhaM family protein [Phycisphaerales bacterium JB043]